MAPNVTKYPWCIKHQVNHECEETVAMSTPQNSSDELTTEQLINDIAIKYAEAHGLGIVAATKDLYPTFTKPMLEVISQEAARQVIEELKFLDTCPAALIYVGIADRIKHWEAEAALTKGGDNEVA
jgi:hypothetical protein